MPQGYLHNRTAIAALEASGMACEHENAFLMGAQGPDFGFFYRAWQSAPKPDINAVSVYMHNHKTGEFLLQLLKYAKTAPQRSYALGFLCHYATDCTFHPYIYFFTEIEGAPYNVVEGHNYLESALESYFHKKFEGSSFVPASKTVPTLDAFAKASIADMVSRAMNDVYGTKLEVMHISDCFNDMLFIHRFFASRFGFKKLFAAFVQKFVMKRPRRLTSLMQGAKRLKKLPQEWYNEFKGTEETGGADELFADAAALGARYLTAANMFFKYGRGVTNLKEQLGSNSYETGMPEKPDEAARSF